MSTTRTTDTPHTGGSFTRVYRIVMFFLLLDWASGRLFRLLEARAAEEFVNEVVLRVGEYTATHTGPLTRAQMDKS